MDAIVRGAVIYLVLLVLFRVAGQRALSQITTFDLVLLLIISETTQQALVGDDFSVTTALLLILTLVGIDVALGVWKDRSRRLGKIIDGVPILVVENGRLLEERMRQARIDEGDVMESARATQGLERLDQIKYAVLERDGSISVIPRSS